MFDVVAVAARMQGDGGVVGRVFADQAQGAARQALRLRQYLKCAGQVDGVNVIGLRHGAEFAIVLDVGAEPANVHAHLLAAVGVQTKITRQGQQLQRQFHRDIARRQLLRHRGTPRLLLGVLDGFANLHIRPIGP